MQLLLVYNVTSYICVPSFRLCCGYMWKKNNFETILKQFQCFTSHVTTDGGYVWNKTLKLFQNYFSRWNYFKIILATLNMLKNIHELQQAPEIILN